MDNLIKSISLILELQALETWGLIFNTACQTLLSRSWPWDVLETCGCGKSDWPQIGRFNASQTEELRVSEFWLGTSLHIFAVFSIPRFTQVRLGSDSNGQDSEHAQEQLSCIQMLREFSKPFWEFPRPEDLQWLQTFEASYRHPILCFIVSQQGSNPGSPNTKHKTCDRSRLRQDHGAEPTPGWCLWWQGHALCTRMWCLWGRGAEDQPASSAADGQAQSWLNARKTRGKYGKRNGFSWDFIVML